MIIIINVQTCRNYIPPLCCTFIAYMMGWPKQFFIKIKKLKFCNFVIGIFAALAITVSGRLSAGTCSGALGTSTTTCTIPASGLTINSGTNEVTSGWAITGNSSTFSGPVSIGSAPSSSVIIQSANAGGGIEFVGSTLNQGFINYGAVNGFMRNNSQNALGVYLSNSTIANGFINYGSITNDWLGSIYLNRSSVTGGVTNSGSITGGVYEIYLENRSSVDSISNTGTMSNTIYTAIQVIDSASSVGTISNSSGGVISGSYSGIENAGSISSISNGAGSQITSTGGGAAIANDGGPTAHIGSITNEGTISTTGGDGGSGIYNIGSIGTITNTGTIAATGLLSYGVFSDVGGTITTLNNAQGAGNAHGALTYTGALPTNYNIIIRSPNSFGQLSATNVTGSMAFNIYGYSGQTLTSGVDASSVTAGTYSDVLQGFTTLARITGTTGSYSGLSYSLVADASNSGMWNLVFTSSSTNIVNSSGNYLSNIGSSLNPTFAGGTLTLLNGDNSSQNFVVQSAGGTLTSPTLGSSTVSGVFSGPGGMIFNGSGTTYMNGVSTYTGGTTVASGTLSVGSSEANNTARLAGDVTVQAAGTLAGHGGVGGNVTNAGKVAPGGSIGTLSVAGNYTQNSGGTLSISITPTANSVLAIGGTASVAGGFAIDASNGTYAKKTYTVLTSAGLTGKFSNISGNLASYSSLNSTLSYDANNAYLTLSAGTTDTQQSLVNTAAVLQGIYTLQNSVLANSFAYDCTVFGANDVCVSAGGRSTAVQAESINNTSGLLIAAYRPHANYRIGAYADQNLSTNSPGGTVKLGNNTPLIGVFGAWNERLDGTGTEVKVSAAYGQKNATVTRSVVGTSDPGTGSSNLTSQGSQVQIKYGFAVMPEVIISPYIGIRYTQNNMGGYTEGTSSTVTAPLTYSALNTNATTALAGLGASYRFIPRATVYASAGVETDTNTANGTYSATGVTGLTPINFNANPVKTRPTATLGAYYDVAKNQRVGVTGIYRQEPFQAASTTTVMATYSVGL